MPPRTRGLDELGRALVTLACEPGLSVVRFAAACGLPRSSAFALVRHLEDAGIVERDAAGLISPGAGAAALGFGALRLSGLERTADALVGGLAEELDATAQLLVGRTALVTRRARWERTGKAAASTVLEAPVSDRARLRLTLRGGAGEARIEEARSCLERTAQALSDHLDAPRGAASEAPIPT